MKSEEESKQKESKQLGISGGMGPGATLFFGKLVTLAPEVFKPKVRYIQLFPPPPKETSHQIPNTTEYVKEIPHEIKNNTKKDRTKALFNEGDSPVPEIVKDCNEFEEKGCCIGVLPCNTAHAFLEPWQHINRQTGELKEGTFSGIQEQTFLPILSMVDVTVQYFRNQYPNIKKIGFLGTNGTVKSKLYHKAFEKYGIEIVVPEEEIQEEVMAGIYDEKYGVKSGIDKATPIKDVEEGKHPTTRFQKGVENIQKQAPEVKHIILGCTEIPMALTVADVSKDMVLVDPMKVTVLGIATLWQNEEFCNITHEYQSKKVLQKRKIQLASKSIEEFTENDMDTQGVIEQRNKLERELHELRKKLLEKSYQILDKYPVTIDQMKEFDNLVMREVFRVIEVQSSPIEPNVGSRRRFSHDSFDFSSEEELTRSSDVRNSIIKASVNAANKKVSLNEKMIVTATANFSELIKEKWETFEEKWQEIKKKFSRSRKNSRISGSLGSSESYDPSPNSSMEEIFRIDTASTYSSQDSFMMSSSPSSEDKESTSQIVPIQIVPEESERQKKRWEYWQSQEKKEDDIIPFVPQGSIKEDKISIKFLKKGKASSTMYGYFSERIGEKCQRSVDGESIELTVPDNDQMRYKLGRWGIFVTEQKKNSKEWEKN